MTAINRAELAAFFGVSLPTVDGWIKQDGCPYTREGRKGVQWEFDSVAVIEWYYRKKFKPSTPRQSMRDPFSSDGEEEVESADEGDRRYAVARADKVELQTAKELGLVVPIEEVAAVVTAENARVRARILSIPVKIRPMAMVLCHQDRKAAEQIVSAVKEEVRDALTEIVSWAPPEETGS